MSAPTRSRLLVLALDDLEYNHAPLHAWDGAWRTTPTIDARFGPCEERARIMREHRQRAHLQLMVPVTAIWPTPDDHNLDVNVSPELDAMLRKSLEGFLCQQLADLGDGRLGVLVHRARWPR
jgi:hypothetical protein